MKKSCAIIAAILSLCMLCACGAIQPVAADTPAPTQAPANTSEPAAPSPEVTEAPEASPEVTAAPEVDYNAAFEGSSGADSSDSELYSVSGGVLTAISGTPDSANYVRPEFTAFSNY